MHKHQSSCAPPGAQRNAARARESRVGPPRTRRLGRELPEVVGRARAAGLHAVDAAEQCGRVEAEAGRPGGPPGRAPQRTAVEALLPGGAPAQLQALGAPHALALAAAALLRGRQALVPGEPAAGLTRAAAEGAARRRARAAAGSMRLPSRRTVSGGDLSRHAGAGGQTELGRCERARARARLGPGKRRRT